MFFSCGKEQVAEIIPESNTEGFISTRTDDCNCQFQITNITYETNLTTGVFWNFSVPNTGNLLFTGFNSNFIVNGQSLSLPTPFVSVPDVIDNFALTGSAGSLPKGMTFHITTICTWENDEGLNIVGTYNHQLTISGQDCTHDDDTNQLICLFDVDIDCIAVEEDGDVGGH